MPTRRDPDGWKRRAKAEPWRRWFLKALATSIVALSNLDGAIAFIERLFARRPAAHSMPATPGSYSITPGTGRLVMASITASWEALAADHWAAAARTAARRG